VTRTSVAWLLSLPLSAVGMLLAHQIAWGFASEEHQATAGHGYLQYGSIFAALVVASLIVGATAQLFRAVGGEDMARAPSAFVFAIVPIVGFLLQEHLEHLVAARELEVTYFLSTPFLLGLLLQLPFAFAALHVTRLILGFVKRVARAIGTLPRLGALDSLSGVILSATDLPLRPALALRCAGRAPPRLG
jgi:hypothetical protein